MLLNAIRLVRAESSRSLSELRVLLGVTYIQLTLILKCESSIGTVGRLSVDYNRLKVPVLQLLAIHGPMGSSSVVKKLAESRGIIIDVHALRMALMRYYKQGLLKRERSGGVFTYAISERGTQRLRWLEQQMNIPMEK
jgi:hypothetical protein